MTEAHRSAFTFDKDGNIDTDAARETPVSRESPQILTITSVERVTGVGNTFYGHNGAIVEVTTTESKKIELHLVPGITLIGQNVGSLFDGNLQQTLQIEVAELESGTKHGKISVIKQITLG